MVSGKNTKCRALVTRRQAGLWVATASGFASFIADAKDRSHGSTAGGSQGWDESQLQSPEGLARAFRKLAHGLDGSRFWWWMRGTRYAVIDNVATPLWDMHTGAWFSSRDIEDGGYELRRASANLYTAPGTTTLLESFTNPISGKSVTVPYRAPKASVLRFDSLGHPKQSGPSVPGSAATRGEALRLLSLEMGEVQIRSESSTRMAPVEGRGTALAVQDWAIYAGAAAAVLDPAVRSVPASESFSDVLSFPAWLEMGDRPGSFVSQCAGRKVFAYGEMPVLWRTLFEKKFPDAARDPYAALS